jgi:hypothetical protein
VRAVSRGRSTKIAANEFPKYNLVLVAVKLVTWVEGRSRPADDYTFFYRNWNANHSLGTGFFMHKGIVSAVKRVEFISERMSYI